MKKQDPYTNCLDHFRHRDTYRLKVKGLNRIFHVNGNQKKARVSVLISDKIDFKNILRDKGEHYVTIKESIQEESE